MTRKKELRRWQKKKEFEREQKKKPKVATRKETQGSDQKRWAACDQERRAGGSQKTKLKMNQSAPNLVERKFSDQTFRCALASSDRLLNGLCISGICGTALDDVYGSPKE
jgi:hypothetical protein